METTIVTLRIPAELRERLDTLAKATRRSRAYLGLEALREYLDNQAWQIEQIQKGIQEADADDFASEDEVKAVFAKWSKHAS
jgi:predicted transcriptional regulator